MGFGFGRVHVSKPLTEFALSYLQSSDNFIADKICPKLPSVKSNDKYFLFDRTNWQITDDLVAPTSASDQAPMPTLSTDTFNIEYHSMHDLISYREMQEADEPLMPEQDSVAFLTEKLLINKESYIASQMFTTTAAGANTSLPAASKWNYTSTTVPLSDIDTGINTVAQAIGRVPNTAIIGREVFSVLRRHAQILDLIKYTQRGIITADLIAACCDLDNLYVGNSVYMSTPEGVTSESVAYIWGKSMLITYVNTSRPNKKNLTHAYQFVQSGIGANGEMQVSRWEDQDHRSIKVEASINYAHKVVCTAAAYLIKDCVA